MFRVHECTSGHDGIALVLRAQAASSRRLRQRSRDEEDAGAGGGAPRPAGRPPRSGPLAWLLFSWVGRGAHSPGGVRCDRCLS